MLERDAKFSTDGEEERFDINGCCPLCLPFPFNLADS